MNRFLSLAYCSAMSRLVSSLSGTPNKHLQLPRLRRGVFVLRAMLDDISNLRCFGVRPPAAMVRWVQRNIWLIISRENSCRLREGRNAGASGAPGDQSRANSNLKVVGVRTRMPSAYDWRSDATFPAHRPASILALGAQTPEPRTLFIRLGIQVDEKGAKFRVTIV